MKLKAVIITILILILSTALYGCSSNKENSQNINDSTNNSTNINTNDNNSTNNNDNNSNQTNDNNINSNNQNSNEKITQSDDPVYNAMMDPNTELGKIYDNILKIEAEMDEEQAKREEKEKQNKIELSNEKKELIRKIEDLEKEKEKISKDDIRYTWIENDIKFYTDKLERDYKDIE